MFGKNKNTTSRTDNLLLESAKAIITERHDARASHILQAQWLYEKPFDPRKGLPFNNRGWIIDVHPEIELARDVRLIAIYIRRDGTSHQFQAEFALIKMAGVNVWEILRAFIHLKDGHGHKRIDVHYLGKIKNASRELSWLQNLIIFAREPGRL